ncbi:MAG: HEAT repeat domain-containing protein [Gemmataceae bacterium]
MEQPLPVPPRRPQSSLGYSVVEVADDNVPVPRAADPGPAKAPPRPGYQVVLVGEEAYPTPPRPRSPAPAPARDVRPARPSRVGPVLVAVLVLLAGPLLILWLAVRSVPPSSSPVPVAIGGGFLGAPLAVATIDPQDPLAGLVPDPVRGNAAPVYLGDDLAGVPELVLETPSRARADEWRVRKGRTAAAALHLNKKEEDGFLKALVRARPDLVGVPFAMGEACRTRGDGARAFKETAESVRGRKTALLLPVLPGPFEGEEKRRVAHQAHMAVLTQVVTADDSKGQDSLVRVLSSIPRPEATRALARLAVFSTDEGARSAAVEALAVRREADSTDILVASLNYPWPAVADNAATAIARLNRKDLVPQLEAMLSAADPRGPRAEVVDGQERAVAHELVRVNHMRNCMLCHAPAERGKTPQETLVAEVPVPTEPLPDTGGGYGQTESELLVRVDVTYLRQDFSVTQDVADWTVGHWPRRQRFDFVVRRRVLTPSEAEELRARLAGPSPYRRAAARALRELTGRDLEANGG